MLGRTKRVENLDRSQGENNAYIFVKVQLPHGAEEYWLLTDQEAQVARENHEYRELPEPPARVGQVALEDDGSVESTWYIVSLLFGGEVCCCAFQSLERIRQRVERNAEDIEANRESWLADLVD